MIKGKHKLLVLTIAVITVLSLGTSAFAYSYNIVFSNGPITYNNWGPPTTTWFSVNSKWNQVRSSGTNPHQGVDILAPYGSTLTAVWAGWTTQVGSYTIQQKLDVNNNGMQDDSTQYCYYYHLSSRQPNGFYSKGAVIGATGNEGGAYGSHLHFGDLDSSSTWCRNEVNYRWTSNWNYGKDLDVFSNAQFSSTSCQITAYFKDETGVIIPTEVRIFHRSHGTSTWTDGGLMTNIGSNTYTYNFSGKYMLNTTIDWMVRAKRPNLSVYSYSWAPAKYDQPDPNPNANAYTYAYYQNTLY